MLSATKRLVFTGMPVADILIKGPSAAAILERYQMRVGERTPLTPKQIAALEAELPSDAMIAPGGSMANTACTVSRLCSHIEASFLCICADDNYGRIFTHAIRTAGLKLLPDQCAGSETSRSYVITDASGERAISRYMGDSMDHVRNTVVASALEGAEIVFLEGELLALPEGYALWDALLAEAKKRGVKVGVTLFGAEQIRLHREKYLSTITQHASLVFGNEEELATLYPELDEDKAYQALVDAVFNQPSAEVVCISRGSDPAWLTTRGRVFTSVAPQPTKVVNTLGAGDAFMSGVLSGLLKGYNPEEATRLGHRIASAVIQQEAPQLENPAALLAA